MPLTFAICLFFVAALAEILRRGGVDLPPLALAALVNGAMAAAGLVLLGRDAISLIRAPGPRLYGATGLGWSWRRTVRLLPLIPIMFIVPVACGLIFTDLLLVVPGGKALASALLVQIVLYAFAQELFFREAALKVFAPNRAVAVAVSAVAVTLFYLPQGLPAAMIAGGGALACMALRIAGMNLLVVAAVHGAALVLFGRVLVAELSGDALWYYAATSAAGHALFAAGVLALLLPRAPRRAAEPG